MNYKIIALLVVCIAMVAAAGCTGFRKHGFRPDLHHPRMPVMEAVSLNPKWHIPVTASAPAPTMAPAQSGTGRRN